MDWRIEQAIRVMEQQMDENVCFATLARRLGLSTTRFHHLFAAETGMPPGAYLRRIRLDAAAIRLRWTRDTVGQISMRLGYASQASFTQAFVRRFGCTPLQFRRRFRASLTPEGKVAAFGPIGVREVDGFALLTKRYTGDLYAVRGYWRDFEDSLRRCGVRRHGALFIGLMYDDPRHTPVEQLRYDCGVTILGRFDLDEDRLARHGLHLFSTRPGRYACLRFTGPRTAVFGAYQSLCDHWARESRFTVTDDPALEVHAVPRHHMDPHDLSFTLMLALE
ncbi:AraC family transcriptional regulator [Geminicoccus flavidas]|uniref:AraC family transcriptional regulator n=1 Tax=Geminicoccus flavidas TaxID=2506407 RepID=UPI0013596782|nr:AraC family transcriptional regulator [Geminicoccus flavidas]